MLEIKITSESFQRFGNVIVGNDSIYHYILVETKDCLKEVIKVNENLDITFSEELTYTNENNKIDGIYNVIRFNPSEETQLNVFKKFRVDITERLSQENNNNNILKDIINDWLSVFNDKNDKMNSYIGTFGEFALIYHCYINYNINLFDYYQKKNYDAIDFVCNNVKIDCKTSKSTFIKFSLTRRQILLKPDITFIRLYESSTEGFNLIELIEELLKLNVIDETNQIRDIKKEFYNFETRFDLEDLNVRYIPSDLFEGLILEGFDSIQAKIKIEFLFEEIDTKEIQQLINKVGVENGK